ncbi:MAG: hypothetical protein LPK21_14380, partial [Hymenobacteraceae bacterium]|nr:hypothetical protein [Hymenobacteraceae bacterium]MDX5513456.1 hypothetical protein [Hymenobacteraceae bacterium]
MINQVTTISDHETEELEALVTNFPYCQTAHLLIAKAAYDKGSMLSNQKLRKAASYAVNRQLLKKLIYTTDATVTLQTINHAQEKEVTPEVETAPEAKEAEAPATTPATAEQNIQQTEPLEKEEAVETPPADEPPAEDQTFTNELADLLTISQIEPSAPTVTEEDLQAIAKAEAQDAIDAINHTEQDVSEPKPEANVEKPATIDVDQAEPALVEATPEPEGVETESEEVPEETTAPEKPVTEAIADTETSGTEDQQLEEAAEELTPEETTSAFDHYLFKPEKAAEMESDESEAPLKITYPTTVIDGIYSEND